MTAEDFIKVVKVETSDSAVRATIETLQKPPGRKPAEQLAELSKWFNQLSADDQEQVAKAMTSAAQSAVFGFFCLIDGVRAFEDGQKKGSLQLIYTRGTESVILNNPEGEFLHDLYKFECDAQRT